MSSWRTGYSLPAVRRHTGRIASGEKVTPHASTGDGGKGRFALFFLCPEATYAAFPLISSSRMAFLIIVSISDCCSDFFRVSLISV